LRFGNCVVKMKVRLFIYNHPSKNHKEGALSSKKMHRKMGATEAPTKTLSLKEGTKHKEVVRKLVEKKVSRKKKASNKLKATGIVDQKLQKKEATDKKAHKIQNLCLYFKI
jgi:hypothetical protein